MYTWYESPTHMARMNPEYIWRAENLPLAGPWSINRRVAGYQLATICTV